MSEFHLGGHGRHSLPLPLEFVCQYAHYDNIVCCPLKVFQIQVSPLSLNETLPFIMNIINSYRRTLSITKQTQ